MVYLFIAEHDVTIYIVRSASESHGAKLEARCMYLSFVLVSWQPAGPFLRERSVRGFEVFEFLHARKGVRFAHA